MVLEEEKSYKILVIDDSPFLNNTITKELRKENYIVYQAFNLKEATEIIEKDDFDYIILDLILPDGEGEDLVEELPKSKRKKIIVLTSDNDTVRRNYLFNAGILDYFSKSSSLPVIINDIKNLIKELEYNPSINILIVEDSSFSRKMLYNILKARRYNVFAAKNAKECFELLNKEEIDLLLLDYELPDMNGYEILTKIKKEKKFASLPVIIVSAADDEEVIAKLLKKGASDFIKKPYSIEHLLLKCSLHIKNYINVKIIESHQKKLNESLKKIKWMEKQRNIFFSSISHDLKIPLSSISGFVDILLEKETDKEKRNYLKSIKNSVQTMLLLINDILDMSRIENGKMSINKEKLNLEEFIEEIKEMFKPIADKKHLTFSVNIEDKSPKLIKTDPLRLKQILVNLIGNAIKFTPENGKVKLLIKKQDGKLQFNVIDTGIGISKEKQKHIFDLFSQEEDSTAQKYGGSGLGLTISSKLVKLLGGELQVESEKDKGSRFFFSIPIETAEEDKDNNKDKKELCFNKRILLADDDESTRKLMSIILSKMCIETDIAKDGEEALEKFKNNRYDAVIMDNNMPNLKGPEVAKKIKELNSSVAVILITADILDAATIKKMQIDEYITKPINKQKLEYILKKIFKSKE